MPGNSSVSTTAHHCLSNYPSTLHSCDLNQVEALALRNSISAIALHKDSITSVHLNCALFEEKVHWNLLTVVAWDHDLLTCKIFFVNGGTTSQFDLLNHLFVPYCVIVLKLLHVDKRGLVLEIQFLRIVILVHSCRDCPDFVVYRNYGVFLVV
jgi:hypothetical protein